MTTLFDILRLVGTQLRDTYSGVATNGSTTTLLDANMPGYTDDFWNGGLLLFSSGSPAGSTRNITDFASASKGFTFSALTSAVVSGTQYTALSNVYPRADLVLAVNKALLDLGRFLKTNTTLVTVTNQEEYELPAGVASVRRVQIATNATEPYEWGPPVHQWREVGGKLVFDKATDTDDLPIRLYYEGVHEWVEDDTDEIDDAISDVMPIVWGAVYYASMSRYIDTDQKDETALQNAKIAQDKFEQMRKRAHLPHMAKDHRYTGW